MIIMGYRLSRFRLVLQFLSLNLKSSLESTQPAAYLGAMAQDELTIHIPKARLAVCVEVMGFRVHLLGGLAGRNESVLFCFFFFFQCNFCVFFRATARMPY